MEAEAMAGSTRRRKQKSPRAKMTEARLRAKELIPALRPVAGLRANPVEVDFEIHITEATSYRFFDCRSYDVCLHIACIGKWRGFTCRACPVAKRFGEQWARFIRKTRLTHEGQRRR